MAVSGLKARFENISGGFEGSSPQPSPLVGKKTEDCEKNHKDNGRKSSQRISKSALKQISKTVSVGGSSPSENRKSKPIKIKSVEESTQKVSKEKKTSENAMSALADVMKNASSSPLSSLSLSGSMDGGSRLLSCSTSSSPKSEHKMTYSGRSYNSDELSVSINSTVSSSIPKLIVEPCEDNKLLQEDCGAPLRQRTNSSKEREEKALSAPLPVRVPKQRSKSSLDSTTAPKIPPKPKQKPTIRPKPLVAPKPKVIPKTSKVTSEKKVLKNIVTPDNPPAGNVTGKIVQDKVISTSEDEQIVKMKENICHLDAHERKEKYSEPVETPSENTFTGSGSLKEIVTLDSLKLSKALENAPGDPFSPLTFPDNQVPERTIGVVPEKGPLTIQSEAIVTPKGEVGSCKRHTTDSGFQEGLDEEDKAKKELSKERENVTQWDTAKREKHRKKRHNIALELLQTEKTYVSRLKIIAEGFRQCIQTLNTTKSGKVVIPDSTINLIFLNIGEIYNLNTRLLTDLEERMDNWNKYEQIGDVVSSIAPFLKLYSTYTAGFEDAMKILTESMAKEKKLDIAVKEFEKTIGAGLGVAHYMLEPVQRIPRYRLLLAEYLKYLPETSEERPSAEKALEIISEAADKTNNRIKEIENSNEILAIQRSLSDYEGTLLVAHRRFIKMGVLQKLSRKTHTPRTFFLFSDILLHTEETGPSSYKFKNELPLYAVKVEIPKVSLVPHAFEVLSTNRSFILSASSEEEKMEWLAALLGAINNDKEKRKSLKRDHSQILTLDRSGFGSAAPILIPDQSVSQCQLCSKDFTFTFRRHHCRACGRVVCGNCSPFKVYLRYMNKEERVCAMCNLQNQNDSNQVDLPSSPLKEQPLNRPHIPSILIVDPREKEREAVMEGYVLEQDGKKWNRCWYMLGKDLALYKFKAHEDIRATDTVPLPGYIITTDITTMTIILTHHQAKKKKFNLKFRTEALDEYELWTSVLEKAIRLEIPESVIRERSPSYPSSGENLSPIERLRCQSLNVESILTDVNEELDNSV